jgi:hypothetical protein
MEFQLIKTARIKFLTVDLNITEYLRNSEGDLYLSIYLNFKLNNSRLLLLDSTVDRGSCVQQKSIICHYQLFQNLWQRLDGWVDMSDCTAL